MTGGAYHRLTPYEVDVALRALQPQVVVIAERVGAYPGLSAAPAHAVIQLGLGSTGLSKIIGRDAAAVVSHHPLPKGSDDHDR